MARQLLTDIRIKKQTTPQKGQLEIWDSKIPGFGIRISPKGTKSFILLYRFKGTSRRLTIGRYPILSLSEARKKAQNALADINNGIDPSAIKIQERSENNLKKFNLFVDEFIDKYARRKNKDWRETQRLLTREFISCWQGRDMTSIHKKDINLILDNIVARGSPSSANHALAAIRRLFNWAVERGVLEHSPCSGIKPPAKLISRDRVLNDDELLKLWQATIIEGYPFGTITQLLILTGQRLGEIRHMHRSQINMEQKVWSIPAEQNKSGRAHEVPLTDLALKIIRSTPYFHPNMLFPSQRQTSNNPVSGIGKAKKRLDELSGVKNWRMHDLRRTVATGMARHKVSPHVVERVLNHTSGTFSGVTGVYNRFGYLPEMREALEIWEKHIGNLIAEHNRT